MVFPGEGDDYYMATRHERSKKTLHNFTLPNLKWGSQRHLRYEKEDSDYGSGAGDQRLRRRSSPAKFDGAMTFRFGGGAYKRSNNRIPRFKTVPSRSAEDEIEEGIEEFREKIMSDLRTEAVKMTKSVFRKQALIDEDEEEQTTDKEIQKEEEPREKEKEREVSPPEAPGAAVEVRPWNLRKRRAACKEPIPEAGNCDGNQYNSLNHSSKGLGIGVRQLSWSSLGKEPANPTKERPKFISTLTKKEIEDDFMTMTGHRPPRRPQKRPRSVQKKIDFLYPALYFNEVVTHDIYKVSDVAENGKR